MDSDDDASMTVWTCKKCTFDNFGDKDVCDICGEPRPGSGASASISGSEPMKWQCNHCKFLNREDSFPTRCNSCNRARGEKEDDVSKICFECGEFGHLATECPEKGGGGAPVPIICGGAGVEDAD